MFVAGPISQQSCIGTHSIALNPPPARLSLVLRLLPIIPVQNISLPHAAKVLSSKRQIWFSDQHPPCKDSTPNNSLLSNLSMESMQTANWDSQNTIRDPGGSLRAYWVPSTVLEVEQGEWGGMGGCKY